MVSVKSNCYADHYGIFAGAVCGNVVSGWYVYSNDVVQLESHATGLGPSAFRPATPLRLPAWRKALASHPDQHFCHYILNGIAQGFHIGCDRTVTLHPCSSNMPAVQQHPQLVEAHIRAEVEAGRLLGPLPPHLASLVQTNPIGLIPKPHQPGKWRLIVDLSSPAGMSINDANYPRLVSHAICFSARCSGTHPATRGGHAAGKAGPQKCVSHGPSALGRSSPAGHMLGHGCLH